MRSVATPDDTAGSQVAFHVFTSSIPVTPWALVKRENLRHWSQPFGRVIPWGAATACAVTSLVIFADFACVAVFCIWFCVLIVASGGGGGMSRFTLYWGWVLGGCGAAKFTRYGGAGLFAARAAARLWTVANSSRVGASPASPKTASATSLSGAAPAGDWGSAAGAATPVSSGYAPSGPSPVKEFTLTPRFATW